MAVKVLLQIKGDASGATTAVTEAETALGGLGTGTDWSAVGTRIGKAAGPAIKQGLMNAGLAISDWLREGLEEKLAGPEGVEAQASLDKLTAELDAIRSKIIAPLLEAIPPVVEALLPLVEHVSNLVDIALPPFVTMLDGLVGTLEDVSQGITDVLAGAGKVIDAITTTVAKVMSFLTDVITKIRDVITGIRDFFDGIKDGIDGLLKPIQDAIKPITDLLADIFGKSQGARSAYDQLTGGPQMAPQMAGGTMSRGGVVNVYTGADPRAVVRALRRYTGDNGDPGGLVRSFRGA